MVKQEAAHFSPIPDHLHSINSFSTFYFPCALPKNDDSKRLNIYAITKRNGFIEHNIKGIPNQECQNIVVF
jgi:hypothetical protein